MDERLLRLFDALYATGSVSRAAEALGQAQPTVSIWLAKLRRELRDPLFVRMAAGMAPTPRAEALIDTVRAAIDILRRLAGPEARYDPVTDSRRFRICMTDASHVTLLPRLLAHLRLHAPAASVAALQIGAMTASLLQSGEADLALGLVPELDSGFYQQALYAQDWVCLVNPAHPRRSRRLTLSDYAREAHVAIVGGTGQGLLEAALAQQGIARLVALELPGFLGLPAIISTTDLIATLPRHIGAVLADLAGLRLHRCPVPVTGFSVKQHWHARFHNDPANRWLRGVCSELFQERSGR